MKNEYKFIDHSSLGLDYIEVYGERFHYIDLYEIVGKSQFMTTFRIRNNSDSFSKFGDSVLGVIFYDRKSLNDLETYHISGNDISLDKIRIDSVRPDVATDKKGDLRYEGLNIDDIESISYLPYKREPETHETGEKKIPVIEIEFDGTECDIDILTQNYLLSKHNSGTELIQYEKEQLIGITLAFNNGKIDSRILNTFGFSKDDLESNLNIWVSLYEVKKRRNQLTDIDKKNYDEINSIFLLKKYTKILEELGNANTEKTWDKPLKIIIERIIKSVEEFAPSILLHGKRQIYWDLESYIHITLRHLKDYQLGDFTKKTPLPYRSDELKLLISTVIGRVKDEIEQYLASNPTSDFRRNGKMAIFYNGDHYHIRINPQGRLTQFHTV